MRKQAVRDIDRKVQSISVTDFFYRQIDGWIDFNLRVADNHALSELFWKTLESPDRLSDEEERRSRHLLSGLFRLGERLYYVRQDHLVSEEIWSRLGAERDAYFTVDGQGTCLADGGFNATLRDYARFGQMCLNGGAFNGQQIVPADWIARSRHGDTEAFAAYHGIQRDWYPEPTYSRQWWILDNQTGVHTARGVFGQLIHIDPPRELVAVKLSTWPDFLNADFGVNTYRAIDAIAAQLANQ